MNNFLKNTRSLVVLILCAVIIQAAIASCNTKTNTSDITNPYPEATERMESKENTTFYIDPNCGSDDNSGTKKNKPWKSFKRVNQLILTKGNKIEILSAGEFRESLFLMGEGTAESPIKVQFAPGRYDFYPKNAYKNKFHISNTNGTPFEDKAVGLYLKNAKYINISGEEALIFYRGKTIEICIDGSSNIHTTGLSFDYLRPTMSEYSIDKVTPDYAEITIHPDSWYEILDNKLEWLGEGWRTKAESELGHGYDPALPLVWRRNNPLKGVTKIEELAKRKLRLYFDKNPGFTEKQSVLTRTTTRDCAGGFIRHSSDVSFTNCNFHYLHGMAIVHQFSENISYTNCIFQPRKESKRVIASGCDFLHFSGIKGKVTVTNCLFDGCNDDPINIHGTHLQITEVLSPKKIKVKFVHNQTYGFQAYFPGDTVAFIDNGTLLSQGKNNVESVITLNDKEYEIVLSEAIPATVKPKHVLENYSWSPEIEITGCKVINCPTRGFLLTSRKKITVTNNEFYRTYMSAILIANDANFWFESSMVKDVTINNNTFFKCAEPVINICPENHIHAGAVHSNITIRNNKFTLLNKIAISAKSTDNLQIINNSVVENPEILNQPIEELFIFKDCSNYKLNQNHYSTDK